MSEIARESSFEAYREFPELPASVLNLWYPDPSMTKGTKVLVISENKRNFANERL
jgi:hypothetical protein